MKTKCPICKSEDIIYLLDSTVPTLQNRVYENSEEAKSSSRGKIKLSNCKECNFSFNADFNESIMVYDEHYDNAVPSKLFIDYYQSICEYLFAKYKLENSVVYDIGCGKGTFLKMLCKMYPSVKGVGIDPSYEGDLNPMENLQFIREFFKKEQVQDKPSLILSRHVFEHIEYPKDFLEIIREPLVDFPNVPIFIEVPDFSWIVEHKTFWDLCYEHCNYFSEKSIEAMFDYPWAQLDSITKSFGDQYLWVEGRLNIEAKEVSKQIFSSIKDAPLQDFVASINESKAAVLELLKSHKAERYQVIVWGMATKGVIFTNNIDTQKQWVDYCVDINAEKQNKCTPVTAHLIQSPDVLQNFSANEKFLVIVMNTNYLQEIKNEFAQYHLDVKFIDAHGIVL